MAYHIFTMRKLMLTDEMNKTNLKMMQVQFKLDDIGDELLELYDQYYGTGTDSNSLDPTAKYSDQDTLNNAGRENVYTDKADKDEDTKKNIIRKKIAEVQQEENRLEQYKKRLETQYSEAQTELKSVETQEAQALQMAVPKYGGITQQG